MIVIHLPDPADFIIHLVRKPDDRMNGSVRRFMVMRSVADRHPGNLRLVHPDPEVAKRESFRLHESSSLPIAMPCNGAARFCYLRVSAVPSSRPLASLVARP